jgi:hypothetical protein
MVQVDVVITQDTEARLWILNHIYWYYIQVYANRRVILYLRFDSFT